MKRVKFYDNEQLDLTELVATQELMNEGFKTLVTKLMYLGDKLFNGLNVTQTAVASGDVEIQAGLMTQSGSIIEIAAGAKETVHILSGTDGVGGWGNGQAAHATLPRYSIVCIKYATRDTDSATKNFYDPNTSSEYTQTVNTRISDYYQITVVHGTPAASPTVPATPEGYVKLADVYVPANATTILNSNITDSRPTAVKTSEDILTTLNSHITNTNNPHNVTAAQIGALPTSGGTVTGHIILNNNIAIQSKTTGGAVRTLLQLASNNDLYVGDLAQSLIFMSLYNPQVNVDGDVYTLWHSGNDGLGSTLDAGLLGGKPHYVQSSTPPISEGATWFDTTAKRWKYCDGTVWKDPLKYQ